MENSDIHISILNPNQNVALTKIFINNLALLILFRKTENRSYLY